MMRKGCLIGLIVIVLIGILAFALSQCDMPKSSTKNPPEPTDAPYEVLITNGIYVLNHYYATIYETKDGITTIDDFWEYTNDKWVFRDAPLRITDAWGQVQMRYRQ
jgi:hypothetical protein